MAKEIVAEFPAEKISSYYVPFKIVEEDEYDFGTGLPKINPKNGKILKKKRRISARGRKVNHRDYKREE